jgi:16S rRNA (guanine966-N2)-methyltransferase
LSRGAAEASFMESNRAARALLEANVKTLGEERRAAIFAADALRPPRAAAPCDLIFLDPPYGEDVASAALVALDAQGWIAPDAMIALESPAKRAFAPPSGFSLLDERRYGKARIYFLARGPSRLMVS